MVEVGDRVLVKIVAFDGKHKLSDRWEPDPYIIVRQPSSDIPVYEVQRENGIGPKRMLHRNLLLPIGSLPLNSKVNREHVPTRKPSYKFDKSISSRSSDSEHCNSEEESGYMIQYPNAPNNEPRDRESESDSESLSESENHSDIRSSGSEVSVVLQQTGSIWRGTPTGI